jgi:predicted RNA binding protein YcfA (HicA-like mRNA interferase family)
MPTFPSMRAQDLQRLLEREFGYRVHAQKGSHKKLRSDRGFPNLTFAFHDGVEIAPGLVRTILTKEVGLSAEEAAELLGIG